jgi:hypothetical protein
LFASNLNLNEKRKSGAELKNTEISDHNSNGQTSSSALGQGSNLNTNAGSGNYGSQS